MERPGLQALLADIRARRVDIVVVYKVDRLTRSLADFAKLVELFDSHDVSFVSVTQSFNTTSSMGRLTLNVLLSFAQFEREVTGERIRDKIAASKKKGLWMGGVIPLGYRVEERKLLVDEPEGATVRLIFERYCDLKSLPALQRDLRERGIVSRVRALATGRVIGGIPFTNGPLVALLRNRVFLGEINHREKSYPGEHRALIDHGLFDEVQEILDGNRRGARERRAPTNMLLAGKVYDDRGNRMSPHYAIKKGVRYRYYVSSVLAQGRKEEAGSVTRVRAMEIERTVLEALRRERTSYRGNSDPATDRDLVTNHIESVTIRPRAIEIVLVAAAATDGDDESNSRRVLVPWRGPVPNPRREVLLPQDSSEPPSGRAMRSQPRTKLILAIATGRRWLAEAVEHDLALDAIATREQRSERHVRDTISLAFLAPDIIRAAVEGRLPAGMGITRLTSLPVNWEEQRRQIGM